MEKVGKMKLKKKVKKMSSSKTKKKIKLNNFFFKKRKEIIIIIMKATRKETKQVEGEKVKTKQKDKYWKEYITNYY